MWACRQPKVQFRLGLQQVEDDHFMLVVAQVLQGTDQCVRVFGLVEQVTEQQDEGTTGRGLCDLVQGVDGLGFFAVGRHFEQAFELVIEHAVMSARGARRRLQVEGLVEQAESHRIALAAEQFDECSRGQHREFQLAHAVSVQGHPVGIGHGRRTVNDQLATQVGFFLVSLDKHLVGPRIKLPVEVLRGLPWIVEAMLGKFHAEPVKRLLCMPDETLHRLVREELQWTKPLLKFRVGLMGM